MGRIIAIDYGTKRIGIAVSDPLQIIASGLTTIPSKEIIEFLKKYTQEEKVDCIVIGDPKNMNNKASSIAESIEIFVNHLRKNFPGIAIERIDERFTSKMAFQAMIDGGLRKKDRQNKAMVDQVSATIILQSYMAINKNI